MWKIAKIIMLCILGYGSYIDIKKKELSCEYLMAGTVWALIGQIFWGIQPWYNWGMGILTGGIFFIFSKFTKEGIGYADSWMILSLGIFCGVWKQITILGIAFLLASVVALIGCVSGKYSRKSQLPFFPFLTIGYLGVML